MDKTSYEDAVTYWSKILDLDIDYVPLYHADQDTKQLRSKKYILDPELNIRVLKLCKNNDRTIFTFFAAVVMVLLHQCFRKNTVAVGIPAYAYKDEAKLCNFLLPVIQAVNGNTTFQDILLADREAITNAYQYQFLNLKDLFAEHGIEKTGMLYQVVVTMEGLHAPGLIEKELGQAVPELIFRIKKEDGQIELMLSCKENAESGEFLDNIYAVSGKIMDAAFACMSVRMNEMDLMDEGSLQKYSVFNQTETVYENHDLISMLKKTVREHAGHTALKFGREELTYEQLDALSDQLASFFMDMGLHRGSKAALFSKPGVRMVLEILGIMKTGAAYIPVSGDYGTERIRYILENSNADMVLVDAGLKNQTDVPQIDLTQMDLYRLKNSRKCTVLEGDDPAYLIYTSGTTGRPKGVLVKQKNISNSINWRIREYQFGPKDICLQLFDFVFDGFLTSLFTALLSGAKVILMDQLAMKNPEKIAEVIEAEKVTAFITVPTLYKSILQSKDAACFNSLTKVTLAGERLGMELVSLSRKILPMTELINEYGPTENSVVSTIKRDCGSGETITIGHPISNTRIYIQNQYGRLMPVGMKGEICLAGAGVVDGYLNEMEQTGLKFVPGGMDAYGISEKVVYHTADLGRWLLNGEIEYLGREDEQVKLHGYRIELPEVEQALMSMKEIKHAAVLVDQEKQVLEAYCVFETRKNPVEIRSHLRKYLPEYMVPVIYYELSSIPVGINGKVNKRNLKKNAKPLNAERERALPAEGTQAECAKMWEEILGVSNISILDNFFELRGYSLQAVTFLNAVYRTYGITIPVTEFFDHPTIQFAAGYIDTHQKREIDVIEPAPQKVYYEMSDAQKRIYYAEKMGNMGAAYHMPAAMIISPRLDPAKLNMALNDMIRRHESLRTTFHEADGSFIQRIHADVSAEVIYENWDCRSDERIRAFLNSFIKPFDLEQAPLFRSAVIDLSNEQSLFVFDMHHIISDGVSVQIMLKEILALYMGKTLPDLRLQYKDYSEWFLHHNMENQKKYWLQRLPSGQELLLLPADYKEGLIRSHQGQSYMEDLETELAYKVKRLASDYAATDYMVFMTYLMILLYKYSNQTKIVIGSPVSGRIHKDTENILGVFVNTLPFMIDIHPEDLFEDVLKRVRLMCVEHLKNQAYPVEKLLNDQKSRSGNSGGTLFHIMFVMNRDDWLHEFDDLNIQPVEMENQTAKYDLSVSVTVRNGHYTVGCQYSTELYQEETIIYFIRHLKTLMEISEVHADIRSLSIVDPCESEMLLNVFNRSETDYGTKKSVIEVFEDRVRLFADKVGVVDGERTFTYRQFERKVRYAADLLIKNGVRPDDCVCVYMERSAEMLAAVYGILKAGAVYVPISPEYPALRIQYILNDCHAACLLTGQELLEKEKGGKDGAGLIQESGIPILLLKQDGECSSDLDIVRKPQDPAYMIYTSGTTGGPKGVLVEHQSLVNILLFLQDRYPVTADGAYLFKTPISFDVSLTELFGWFFEGGRIIILPQGDEKDPKAIAQCIGHSKITHINFVPSMLHVFLAEAKRTGTYPLDSLSYILAAGEELKPETARLCAAVCPSVRLENLYGPTETCIYATSYRVQMTEEVRIPIGTPCANTKCYVMNDPEHLCGIGVMGELCVAGTGLARGYQSRPELTEERFVYSRLLKERVYRTGDLARISADGTITYLGRLDSQVKIRGNRIEIDEIESEILKTEGVENAAVVVKEKGDGKVLWAYVVAHSKDLREIRKELYGRLPAYMVPSGFTYVNEIPVSINGKADKKALAFLREERERELVRPRSGTEKRIAQIWKETLLTDEISVEDALFDIGGDSITAIQILGKINSEFGVEYEIVDLFQYVTIELLAEKIDRDLNSSEKQLDNFDF